MQRLTHQFINQAWVPSQSDQTLAVRSPVTERLIAEVTTGTPADVDAAVAAARDALPGWRGQSGAERAGKLTAIADGLTSRQAELSALSSYNNGKPKAEADQDVADAIACFRYYADQARLLDARQGEAVVTDDPDLLHRRYYEAAGVAGLITPWNFPLMTSAWKIAPALAAGCTIVFKPSEVTPLPEQVLADIMLEADLPAGVFNLVHGNGENVGAALTGHPGIDKLSFTGSNAVGEKVMQAAASGPKNLSLELGGKSPIIVTEDADLSLAVELVTAGFCFNAGQMCSATTRLLVHETIADTFYDQLTAALCNLVAGDPEHPDTTLGPLVNAAQHQRVKAYIEQADHEDLRALLARDAVPLPEQGYYIAPQVYLDVPRSSRLWQEEIFGPILCTRTFNSDEEAVDLANDSDYGLVATVVSGHSNRAAAIARRLEVGNVWCNTHQVAPPALSWGGMKRSSLGRELGPTGLASYQETRYLTEPR